MLLLRIVCDGISLLISIILIITLLSFKHTVDYPTSLFLCRSKDTIRRVLYIGLRLVTLVVCFDLIPVDYCFDTTIEMFPVLVRSTHF